VKGLLPAVEPVAAGLIASSAGAAAPAEALPAGFRRAVAPRA